MCDLNGPIRLCTCSTKVDRTKPHWILKTNCSEKFVDLGVEIIGTFSFDFLSDIEFAERLNEENLFDFDYSPAQDDILYLKLTSNRTHTFIFNSGKWKAKDPFGNRTTYKHNKRQSGIIETEAKK